MVKFFYLRQGQPVWPVDVRSIGISGGPAHPSTSRPDGAPFAILMWTLQGKGMVESRGVRHPLRRGTVFIIPHGTPHQYGPAGKPDEWQVEWLTLDGLLCPDYLAMLGMDKLVVRDIGIPPDTLFQRLLQSTREPGITGSLERAHQGIHIACETHARLSELLGRVKTARFREMMERAALHVDYELNVDYLVRRSGLTRSHFSRAFTAETGMTPVRFVMDLKLGKAKTLLLSSDMSVKEIARECGFFDTAHFSRQFVRFTGLTPTVFRNQQPV